MAEPINNGFNPIKNKRLFEIVGDQIRQAILTGNYNSGDRLASEKELCQSFQVGRPVIREALRTLENSGMLSIRPGAGGGIFIKKLNSDNLMNSLETIVQLDKVTIQQITEARFVIEKSVWALALERIQPEDIQRLEENIALARECLVNKIPEPRSLGFHIILAEASRNPLLVMIIKALLDVLQKYLSQLGRSMKRKKKVIESHELILEHIKKGNLKEAMEILEADIMKLSAEQQPEKYVSRTDGKPISPSKGGQTSRKSAKQPKKSKENA
jgi:GntR family transcriptional regulator, transcriptional repressor for pyruvate dehydrogenase complex